jgi:aminoglycoside/choline kinase family phosphotransferase
MFFAGPMSTDPRLQTLHSWLTDDLGLKPDKIVPASADASFRRYFRVWCDTAPSLIVMDAPPDKEDLGAYLRVSALLERCGMHVPQVHAHSTTLGLALLEDLGSTHMLTALQSGTDAAGLYADALGALAGLQLRGGDASRQLRPYDEATLQREMRLMPEWFCARHLGFVPHDEEVSLLADSFDFLVAEALAQPQVFVHRDYHSRNLMIVGERSPGVIDFQDALRGPVAYDLASILKDCYVDWPRERIEAWVAMHRQQLCSAGESGRLLAGDSTAQMLRWLDVIGLQRHIKVLGIFARLNWRDGKSGYLADLPRTLEYVRDAAARFPELARLSEFVERRLVVALPAANERALAAAAQGATA